MTKQDSKAELDELARRHLWPCFSPLKDTGTLPLIVRGEGCYVFDDEDNGRVRSGAMRSRHRCTAHSVRPTTAHQRPT